MTHKALEKLHLVTFTFTYGKCSESWPLALYRLLGNLRRLCLSSTIPSYPQPKFPASLTTVPSIPIEEKNTSIHLQILLSCPAIQEKTLRSLTPSSKCQRVKQRLRRKHGRCGTRSFSITCGPKLWTGSSSS